MSAFMMCNKSLKLTYYVTCDMIKKLKSNKVEVVGMKKDNSNSVQLDLKSLNENISEALEIIEEKRRMQNYAEMILYPYNDSGIRKGDSTRKKYSLKVEDFFDYSSQWKAYVKGELNLTIYSLKEDMRMKMNKMLEKDILPYVNSMIKKYEFYLEKSEIAEGYSNEKRLWGYEYKFFINVREKKEVG